MQSMDVIYKEHARMVYGYLLSLSHDADVAEELTQETFYQAIRSVGRFDGSCKVTTWLCGIAKNLYFAYRRKHPLTVNVEDEVLPTPSAEQEALDNIERMELMRRVHACAEPYREVLYLRLFGDLSYREIGDIMGKSENWARVTCYRGRAMVRKEMENDEK